MEDKKKPKSDLSPLRSLFLAIGILVSVSIISAAFEYKTNPPLFPNPDLFYDDDEFWCTFPIIIEPDTIPKEEPIYLIAESEAMFPDGEKGWMNFLKKNLKAIPTHSSIKGKVFISFIINKKGELSDFTIIRGLTPIHDKEVLRVMALSPNWKPAQMGDKNVNSRKVISFNFPQILEVMN